MKLNLVRKRVRRLEGATFASATFCKRGSLQPAHLKFENIKVEHMKFEKI